MENLIQNWQIKSEILSFYFQQKRKVEQHHLIIALQSTKQNLIGLTHRQNEATHQLCDTTQTKQNDRSRKKNWKQNMKN